MSPYRTSVRRVAVHGLTRIALAAIIVQSAEAGPAAAAQGGSPEAVLAGYQQFYRGDFTGSLAHFQDLQTREPRNLPSWYGLLAVQVWPPDLDPVHESSLERSLDEFLAAADQRYARSHADSEALFYLANGYLLRARYRFEHDKGMFGAARDAAKAKGFAEAYVKQHPEHGDAYLTLGMYNYYVGIAPSFVRVLRVLLLLPAGSRTEGLAQLERAARDGSLFAPQAEDVLVDIYGSTEGRVSDALRVAEALQRGFPGNDHYQLQLARLYASPSVEAYERAAAQYHAIIDRAGSDSPDRRSARLRAILGLAELKRTEWRIEEAVALLTPTIDAAPVQPRWTMPSFLLRRGNYRALLNDAAAADDARRVLADSRMAKWHKGAQAQIAFIEARRKSDEGLVYAALIPGNRSTIERQWTDARAAYERVAEQHPGDWQVRYRLAFLEFWRGNYETAARGFEPIVSTSAPVPKWLRSSAMLNLAWVHDIAGRRADALKLYHRVVDEHADQAAASAARVGLLTPYRPRPIGQTGS